MGLKFDARTWSVAGRRGLNQDASLATDSLVAVADGVGGVGPAAGAASRLAIDRMASLTLPMDETGLEGAIQQASRDVADLHGATTLCVAVADSTSVLIGNVGDSRAQLVTSAGLQPLTQDHSDAARRAREGIAMSKLEEQLRGKLVYSVLGGHLQVDICRLEMRAGARLLLSTDGLHDYYPDLLVFEAVRLERALPAARWALEVLVGRKPPADDVTFVVADLV